MKKRFGILLLLSVLVVSLLTVVNVSANEIICSGYCGGDNTCRILTIHQRHTKTYVDFVANWLVENSRYRHYDRRKYPLGRSAG